MPVDIPLLKDIVSLIESLITILAIIVGGIWGYQLFIRKREQYPSANLSHQIFHLRLPQEKILLTVDVELQNTGNVLISLDSGEVRIQQIMPICADVMSLIRKGDDPVQKGETEIRWPLLDSRVSNWAKGMLEIEPGESHQISYDFILDGKVQKVKIYSWFRNQTKHRREIGWCETTLYDITA